MRVNITYSVELDDVPGEVARILEECEQVFRSLHGQLDQTIGKEPLYVLDELNELRIRLAKLDLKLGDSMDILSGYISAVAQAPEMTQEAIQDQARRVAAIAAQLEETNEEV